MNTNIDNPFDAIRKWRRILNIDDHAGQFLCTAEEAGEWGESLLRGADPAEKADAIGDMAVVATVHWDIDQGDESQIEAGFEEDAGFPSIESKMLAAVGRIGRGIRKHRAQDIRLGSTWLFNAARQAAEELDIDFDCCVKMVTDHLYQRLADGYVLVSGSAIKKKDYERMVAEGSLDPNVKVVAIDGA